MVQKGAVWSDRVGSGKRHYALFTNQDVLTTNRSVCGCAAWNTRRGHMQTDLDSYINRMMAAYQIPGLAVAVIHHGETQALNGYGLASIEFGIAVDTESVFPLYSVSKIFAGITAMQLVEAGLLELDRPLPELLGVELPNWQAIIVRHLLSHTAALGKWPAPHPTEPLAMLRDIAAQPLIGVPGAAFSYNQTSYAVFGLLVEQLTGISYTAWLAEKLFQPLGLASMRFGDSLAIIPNRPSTAYNRNTGVLKNWIYQFSEMHYPAAGLNGSIRDLATLLSALGSGRVLRPESFETIWSPVQLNDGTTSNYGLGWTIDTHEGKQIVGHEGGGAAWIAHLPAEQLWIAVVCNLNGARADEIQYGIATMFAAAGNSQ